MTRILPYRFLLVLCLIFAGYTAYSLLGERPGVQAEEKEPSVYIVELKDMPVIPTDKITVWPEQLKKGIKMRPLVNGSRPGGPKDALLGYAKFLPNTKYPVHVHDQSEIYYILSGTAKMTYGEKDAQESHVVTAGTALYTPSAKAHGLEVVGDEPVEVLTFWWAAGGDPAIIGRNYKILYNQWEQ